MPTHSQGDQREVLAHSKIVKGAAVDLKAPCMKFSSQIGPPAPLYMGHCRPEMIGHLTARDPMWPCFLASTASCVRKKYRARVLFICQALCDQNAHHPHTVQT